MEVEMLVHDSSNRSPTNWEELETYGTRSSIKSVIVSKFQTVWESYYEWEVEHCAQAIRSLSVVKPVRPPDIPSSSETTGPDKDSTSSVHSTVSLEEHSDVFEMTVHYMRDDCCEKDVIRGETTSYIDLLTPHPVYESCAPIPQNILHGDDSNYMPFLPLADDPGFDVGDHALEYKAFAWQEAYRDPDTLEIAVETARRLHAEDGLSPAVVDSTGLLPLALQTASVWGAIWTSSHSDPVRWPGSSQTLLPDVAPPAADDLQARLKDYLTLWCPNLSCLQGHCFSHNVEKVDPTNSSPETPFRCLQPPHSCGKLCVFDNTSSTKESVSWSTQDIDDLRTISRLGTPMTPCDLAILCHKPCYEVALMCQRYNNFYVPTKRPRGRPTTEHLKKPTFALESGPDYVPDPPCNHSGPCGPNIWCACFDNKAHCSRNCRCSSTCLRRWRGCKCASLLTKANGRAGKGKSSSACNGPHCPCWTAKRECDPEVCSSCEPNGNDERTCRNMQVQMEQHKRTEVRSGTFGLGLFLSEDVRKGDLITEYLGELIYEPTFLCRGQVSGHIKRSYVFALNKLFSVDATPAGNNARFINHAPSNKANVAVSILLVNGEQRIGVFATKEISSGQELFMDYGPEYPIEPPPGNVQ
ncbi:hypothetical protein C8Q77DRAFT_1149517 [Trametes polyzona]|nr:hypothetical protein C8Q77DRAFT_1149517 [Trametes polyzona]